MGWVLIIFAVCGWLVVGADACEKQRFEQCTKEHGEQCKDPHFFVEHTKDIECK